MTPFMHRVAAVVGCDGVDDVRPEPPTRPSAPTSVGTGADRQVAVRALAEQLVCEANAILAAGDDHFSLADELSSHELAFSIHYRGRRARVSTAFAGGIAYGRLVGDGIAGDEPRELVGPQALPDLLVLLLMESDVPRHPAAW